MTKKQKTEAPTQRDLDHALGVVEGIQSQMWTCGDCGTQYEYTAEECPNVSLDQALARVRHLQYLLN